MQRSWRNRSKAQLLDAEKLETLLKAQLLDAEKLDTQLQGTPPKCRDVGDTAPEGR